MGQSAPPVKILTLAETYIKNVGCCSYWWRRTMSLNCSHKQVYCSSPKWWAWSSGGMIFTGESQRTQLETCVSATLFSTNPLWNEMHICGDRLAIICLSHGMAWEDNGHRLWSCWLERASSGLNLQPLWSLFSTCYIPSFLHTNVPLLMFRHQAKMTRVLHLCKWTASHNSTHSPLPDTILTIISSNR
jgi:hypothetical protein